MKVRDEVTADKLRGGFYTPQALVDFCWQRAASLIDGERTFRVLEPSAGDGAFVRGIARTADDLRRRVTDVVAAEIVPAEAAKAELSLRALELPGQVLRRSILPWAADTDEWFGLVVGNPPFVRYQFVSQADKAAIATLGGRLGLTFGGVGNLWIPVLLGSLARLEPGGALSVVLPTECFTGSSAGVVRDWLMGEFENLTFDLFPPGSFPDVLQEVAVVSGRRAAASAPTPADVGIVEHSADRRSWSWSFTPKAGDRSWTRFLLDPRYLAAIDDAQSLAAVSPLGKVARMEVSIVTGANDFFCVDDATVEQFGLRSWAKPLLARSKYAPGLIVNADDLREACASGARAWLLDFDAAAPDPARSSGSRSYLRTGIKRRLPARYKCSIRKPWYRVPSVRAGGLLLSKRSHLFPRLMLNEADAYTTDTIYRGDVLPGGPLSAADLVAGFHCSLTLLTVELEGRSFGGGVLELVPSEIARLCVVNRPGLGEELARLDEAVRAGVGPDDLVAETDAMLVRRGLLSPDTVALLAEARHELMARRLHRNAAGGREVDAWTAEAA
jgi:adenine-specific DNA-methyltransferase